jgi:hypothetical protein
MIGASRHARMNGPDVLLDDGRLRNRHFAAIIAMLARDIQCSGNSLISGMACGLHFTDVVADILFTV